MKNKGQGQEPEVTLDGIDASLRELVKAADATDLTKALGGVSVENGGHTDERGATSGGYAEQGDIGGLDSMMIGKMQSALIDAGFDAGAIAAFMRGKASEDEGDDDDQDGGDDDQDGGGMPPAMSGKFGKPADSSGGTSTNGRPKPTGGKGKGKGGMAKSEDAFRADPAIADAMDVSPFLGALVQKTSEQLDDIRKSLDARADHQDEVTKKMAAAVYGVGQLVKGIAEHARRLDERLGFVERQPQPQRGHTALPAGRPPAGYRTPARPLTKSMPGEAGAPQPEQLTKGEVLSVLSYMNLEKGQRDERYRQIGGQQTSEIIGIYEGGGGLPRTALEAVYGFLESHPHEAAVARSYR